MRSLKKFIPGAGENRTLKELKYYIDANIMVTNVNLSKLPLRLRIIITNEIGLKQRGRDITMRIRLPVKEKEYAGYFPLPDLPKAGD